jgi:hypothetical protein
MAAGANEETSGDGNSSPTGISVPDESVVAPTQSVLRHNPGLSVEWASHEQSLLEELLTKYALESHIVRYAKIAMELKDKTVRDVALRCRWVHRKENGKRRKEESKSSRRYSNKKEKLGDQSAKSHALVSNLGKGNGSSSSHTKVSIKVENGITYEAVSGSTGQPLERNAPALDHISSNLEELKLNENFNLLLQSRNSILMHDSYSDSPLMPPPPLIDDPATTVYSNALPHSENHDLGFP